MQDELGAFCQETHVALPGAAEGPLAGLSFAAKDVFDVAGHTSGCGNPDWLKTHGPAGATAPALQGLLDAGASLVGKTHTDELTYSLNGENAHYGTPVNPNAPGRIPGGSSSGSAAVVAGRLVDFSIGTDCGGSVRLPASYCGILGFRPSHGRITLDGIMPLASSFDTVGWFANDAEVLARVGEVLLDDRRATEPTPRLLLAVDAFDAAGAEVSHALEGAVDAVRGLLGESKTVTVSAEGLSTWMQTFRVLQGAEIWANHRAWITETKPNFGPGIRERFEWASTIDESDVALAKARREAIAGQMAALLGGDAVLCLPTAPGIAPLRDTPQSALDDFRTRALSLLCIAGLARLPQINLPLGALDGCPIGLSLVGPRGADMVLLSLAETLVAGR